MISKLSNFKLIVLAAIILGSAIIFAGWYFLETLVFKDETYFADIQNANSYSLNGKLLSLQGNSITLEVGQVVTTSKGNELEYKKYTVEILDTTQIVRRNPDNPSELLNASKQELSLSKNITVYTETNPYNTPNFKATKIEIN